MKITKKLEGNKSYYVIIKLILVSLYIEWRNFKPFQVEETPFLCKISQDTHMVGVVLMVGRWQRSSYEFTRTVK